MIYSCFRSFSVIHDTVVTENMIFCRPVSQAQSIYLTENILLPRFVSDQLPERANKAREAVYSLRVQLIVYIGVKYIASNHCIVRANEKVGDEMFSGKYIAFKCNFT